MVGILIQSAYTMYTNYKTNTIIIEIYKITNLITTLYLAQNYATRYLYNISLFVQYDKNFKKKL